MLQRFESKYLDQRVAIDEPVYETLIEAATAAGGHETGGILIGRYTDSRLAIVEHATTAPRDSRRGHGWFERGTDGLEEILQRHWDAPVRRYYIGEWHFHPSPDGTPSDQDMAQMFEVASQQRYDCKHPVLMIISHDMEGAWLFRVLLFAPEGCAHELTIALQGDASK